MKKRKLASSLFFILFPSLIFISILTLYTGFYLWQINPASLTLADKIYNRCYPEGKKKTTCYDNALSDLTKTMSMTNVFKVTAQVQKKDKDYAYCHVVGHKIASEEVKKDPARWQEVVQQCPNDQCANGCIHGAFQERFKAEHLSNSQVDLIKSELTSVCIPTDLWQPSYISRTACYHALGHMFMYMTSADTNRSLSLCREILKDDPQQDLVRYCYEGAFMQVYQSLGPEDDALVKLIKPRNQAQSAAFCNRYTDNIARVSCWNQSWPLFFKDISQNPDNLVRFCSNIDLKDRFLCYGPLISIITVQFKFNNPKINNYCLRLPHDIQGLCFNTASQRMVEVDSTLISKAINLCALAPMENASGCYKGIFKMFQIGNYFPGDQRQKVCKLFPEQYLQECLG